MSGLSFLSHVVSNDGPCSRRLACLLAAIVIGLVLAPAYAGHQGLQVAAKVLVFIVLVASYDLLLGYCGVISFAHTMFFGIGAYGLALGAGAQAGWWGVGLGVAAALLLSLLLALAIGVFSLRVRAIFFSMITLAVAAAFQTVAAQWSSLTGGDDGLAVQLPLLFGAKLPAAAGYALLALASALQFLLLLRVVNSPFGRALQAVRENAFRADAIGLPPVLYRIAATVIGALFATSAGVMTAAWSGFTSVETTLGFELMLDVLLVTVIGGTGTLYGAVVGSAAFLLAQGYLQALLGAAGTLVQGVPLIAAIVTPDRWLLWLGLLFVIAVRRFPSGIVGGLRAARRKLPASFRPDSRGRPCAPSTTSTSETST